ncbi:MAG: DMT family transporter [Pseudomonadota bacterium]
MGWGEFFALASPMAWAGAVVMFRRSGETLPPFELNLLKNVLALLLTILTLVGFMLLAEGAWPEFSGLELSIILLSGILGMALGDTLYLRTLNLVGAGRMGVIGSLLSPFVILISAAYLGERLAAWQWAGFALVMAGILVVTLKRYRSEVSTADLRKGLVIGVAAMATVALGVVMVKPLLEKGPFLWVVALRLAAGVAVMLMVIAWRRDWGRVLANYQSPQPWTMTLTACFLGGFGGSILWLAGYKLIPASEASIYNEAQLIFMVLFAWWFLGESLNARKIVGVLLTLAGVLVMLLA